MCLCLASATGICQENPTTKKTDISANPSDHFMLQLASNHWTGEPDSISRHTGGLNRSANIYLMLDKPFKGNNHFSLAFGLGIGTSSIYFKKMSVLINSTNAQLPFVNKDSSMRFKKYKLSSSFLEVPIEFRFSSNPAEPSKSVKAAVGVKIGTMLNSKTKGKTLESSTGQTINSYTEKIISKKYFNTTRAGATARLGYGNFTAFGTYYFTPVFKDGVAADMKSFQVGLTLSGL